MRRVRVALFKNRGDAESCQARLLQAGIPAEVHVEPAVAWFWFVSRNKAGVRLEVPAECVERVERLLLRWSSDDGLLDGAIRCPDCGSLCIDFPQFTEKSLLTNVVMGLAAEARLFKREYYCESCHFMWARPEGKPRRPRTHTAPNYFIERDD